MRVAFPLIKPRVVLSALLFGGTVLCQPAPRTDSNDSIDQALTARLQELGFTGAIETYFHRRLARPIDRARANLGRLLWFDTITGLNNDNTCAGCHSPTRGFGDTQSIAIGIENNGIVGPDRKGPRNQRRTPMAANTAFFPALMWNERFFSASADPFDNSAGFVFPPSVNSTGIADHLISSRAALLFQLNFLRSLTMTPLRSFRPICLQ